jgi:hypothetical protein
MLPTMRSLLPLAISLSDGAIEVRRIRGRIPGGIITIYLHVSIRIGVTGHDNSLLP